MRILSVNVGIERPHPNGKPGATTGIYKLPVTGPVEVTSLGLQGDVIQSVKHHGGPDQAVYIYGQGDYDWWQQRLGRALEPGTFGENLTISELESAEFRIGDRLAASAVVLEVTAPRIPCATFAGRMGDRDWVVKFRDALRPGLYCRVIQTGSLQAGEDIRLQPFSGETISIREMFAEYYTPDLTEAGLRRYLNAPIAIRDRLEKEKRLQELLAAPRSG